MQFGHSLGDGLAIHSAGEQMQSEYLISNGHYWPFRNIIPKKPLPESAEVWAGRITGLRGYTSGLVRVRL